MPKNERGKRITIIGLGLIGGSIGLALRSAGLPGVEIAGHDRNRDAETAALKKGAVDRAEHNLPRAVEGAGIVIIATPVLALREVLEQIAPHLVGGAVVTDTASTKAQVMKWAADLLPTGVSFVGGHPMAGKETQGIEHAEANLFRGKAYCVVPAVEASDAAVRSVLGLLELLGAEPLFVDPEEHDIYAAAVSHLPLMISAALFHLLRSSPAWPDMGAMASSGFRDMTRLASGDPTMSHDIWVTNREAVIHWLDRMAAELQRFRDLLQDAQDDMLLETFARAQIERESFLARPPRRTPEAAATASAAPRPGQALMDLLVGGLVSENLRRIQKIPELAGEAKSTAGPAADRGTGAAGMSRAARMAEDIRRDLEKLQEKRARKQAAGGRPSPPDSPEE